MPKKKHKIATEVEEAEALEVQELARPGYEDPPPVALEDEEVYLPPHLKLEDLTKEQIAQLSMRHFGVRPDERALKAEQVAEVTRRMRAGRPGGFA